MHVDDTQIKNSQIISGGHFTKFNAHQSFPLFYTILTYPDTLVPASLMKLYFATSFLATSVQKSLLGFGIKVYIVVIKSLVIALRTLVESSFLFSASVGALIATITLGLHVSGMANFLEACADVEACAEEEPCADDDGVEAIDNVSSPSSNFL